MRQVLVVPGLISSMSTRPSRDGSSLRDQELILIGLWSGCGAEYLYRFAAVRGGFARPVEGGCLREPVYGVQSWATHSEFTQ